MELKSTFFGATFLAALLPIALCGIKEIVDSSDDRVVYRLSWEVDESGENVNFNLIHEGIRAGSWTGVGFNEQGSMPGMDLIKVTVSPNGRVSVEDYTVNGYTSFQIKRDFPTGPIEVKSASWSDNTIRAEFSRPIIAPETSKMRSLGPTPLYWFFPYSGGEDFGVMRKHRRTPEVEKVKLEVPDVRSAGRRREISREEVTLERVAPLSGPISEHCEASQKDDGRCEAFLQQHFDLTTPRDLECKRWVDYKDACCLALATPRRACVYV